MNVDVLPIPIRRYVRSFVAQRRRYALVRAGGGAVAVLLGITIATCLLDRRLQLPDGVRFGALIGGLAVFLLILLRPLRFALRSRVAWLEAAAEIETVNPAFAERLRTVVSQLMEKREYRGSDAMLARLVAEVEDTVRSDRPGRRIPWRKAAPPWMAVALLLILLSVLAAIPTLGMRTLMVRALMPTAGVEPVTTTLIAVEPRAARLVRGDALNIRARVQRLDGGSVEIFTSHTGKSFSRIAMLPVSEGEYVFTLPTLDRDLKYFVRAGDAETPVYTATVLRPPAVAEYRMRFEYPAYTQRQPLGVSGTDGVIEALAGTKVSLAIVSTEPLASATLTLAGDRIPLARSAAEPNVATTELILGKSGAAELELVSAGGLTTRAPGALQVRAQPDREPLVRLLQPAEDLRLHPRDLLPLQYQAMDDYGIASLSVLVQVNATPVRTMPVTRGGDPRRLEGTYSLDLAALEVKVGDVVTLGLEATDGAGRRAGAEPKRHILVSPRSIDIATHQRVADLRQSSQLAAATRQELERASESLEKARKQGGESAAENLALRLAVSRALTNAVESGMLLHQTLLRVVTKSPSPEATCVLAATVDRARVQVHSIERLVGLDAESAPDETVAERLKPAIEDAKQLAATVRTLGDGEQAATILADLANVKAPATRPADKPSADRLRETLRRARQDIAFAVEELGLQPDAPDLHDRLTRRMESARQLTKNCRPVGFDRSAKEWSEVVAKNAAPPPPLAERLLSASAVEALRPDGDAIRARDLQLASRAARRLQDLPRPEEPDQPDPVRPWIEEFPAALAAVQKEHAIAARASANVRPPEELAAARKAGADARARLSTWANQTAAALLAAETAASAEDLALEAAAETYRRAYAAARQFDRRAAQRADGEPADYDGMNRDVDTLEKIDSTANAQTDLAKATADATTDADADALAERQGRVATRIGEIEAATTTNIDGNPSPDHRRRATAAIQSVQEQLATLPQSIAAARESAEAYRLTLNRAADAQREASAAPDDRKPVAQRAAQQAQAMLKDADDRLQSDLRPLSPDLAETLARDLRPFEPETAAATTALAESLQPALHVLAESMRSGDKAAADRAAQKVRSSLESLQSHLREAQLELIERDPVVAARWFADAAAAALHQRPPDFRKARQHQDQVNLSLARAWQSAARDLNAQRYALTPGLRPAVSPRTPATPDSPAGIADLLPSFRQWGFLRPRSPGSTISAPLTDSDPPGYAEPLRLYFEALNKAQDKP